MVEIDSGSEEIPQKQGTSAMCAFTVFRFLARLRSKERQLDLNWDSFSRSDVSPMKFGKLIEYDMIGIGRRILISTVFLLPYCTLLSR